MFSDTFLILTYSKHGLQVHLGSPILRSRGGKDREPSGSRLHVHVLDSSVNNNDIDVMPFAFVCMAPSGFFAVHAELTCGYLPS